MADEVHFIRFFYPENYKYSIFPTGYFERQENIKQQEKQLTFKLSGIINLIDNFIIGN